ncbi:MAG TPA: hypothetical protein DCG28_00915 [Lachnospiraceae bacterium]|nr:hypothetical protein [Lachnospiraceae bacterium]
MKKALILLPLLFSVACSNIGPTTTSSEATEPVSEAAAEVTTTSPESENIVKILVPEPMGDAFEKIKENYAILEPGVDIQVSTAIDSEMGGKAVSGGYDILITDNSPAIEKAKSNGILDSSTEEILCADPLALVKAKGSQSSVSGFELVENCSQIAVAPSGTALGDATRQAFDYIGKWGYVNSVSMPSISDSTAIVNTVSSTPGSVGILFGSSAKRNADKLDTIAIAGEYIFPEQVTLKIIKANNSSSVTEPFMQYIQTKECVKIYEQSGYAEYVTNDLVY